MLLSVISAKYIENYKLSIKFSTGETKIVDLKDELWGDIFEPLKDESLFKDFHISFNTIEWNNGADFAPEFLYEIGLLVDSTQAA